MPDRKLIGDLEKRTLVGSEEVFFEETASLLKDPRQRHTGRPLIGPSGAPRSEQRDGVWNGAIGRIVVRICQRRGEFGPRLIAGGDNAAAVFTRVGEAIGEDAASKQAVHLAHVNGPTHPCREVAMVPPAAPVTVVISGLRCADQVIQDLDEVQEELGVLGKTTSINRPQTFSGQSGADNLSWFDVGWVIHAVLAEPLLEVSPFVKAVNQAVELGRSGGDGKEPSPAACFALGVVQAPTPLGGELVGASEQLS